MGCACLASLVRWWADCQFSGMTLSLQAMCGSPKSMSSVSISRQTLSLSRGLSAAGELSELVLDVIGATRRSAMSRSKVGSHV